MWKKIVLMLLVTSALIFGVACEKDVQEEDSQESDFVWPGSDENPIVLPEDTFE